jgi:oxygen-dependent protoporphyrinogen oxidase
VRGIAPDGDGYLLDDGTPGGARADAVVLAGPAWVSARLLDRLAPGPAAVLASVAYASVALVAMAFPEEAVTRELDASGFVVPRPEGLTMTGCTWADRKWAHLRRPGQVLLRVSAGRVDNDDAALPDDELVGRLRADLATTMGLTAAPSELRIHRWPRSFPQFPPGHLPRMAAALDELGAAHPRLAVAGSALAGVGVPACIGTGRAAARRLRTAPAAGPGGTGPERRADGREGPVDAPRA